jgi:hypothetical protein
MMLRGLPNLCEPANHISIRSYRICLGKEGKEGKVSGKEKERERKGEEDLICFRSPTVKDILLRRQENSFVSSRLSKEKI